MPKLHGDIWKGGLGCWLQGFIHFLSSLPFYSHLQSLEGLLELLLVVGEDYCFALKIFMLEITESIQQKQICF